MHALPIVAFDLPYLEFLRDRGNGITVVPQNDIQGAAKAIVGLFSDVKSYREHSDAALRAAEKFSLYDFVSAWKNILSSLGEPEKFRCIDKIDEQTLKLVFQQLISGCVASMSSIDARRQELHTRCESVESELKKQKQLLSDLRRSFSYRLGRALTWGGRKIRQLLKTRSSTLK